MLEASITSRNESVGYCGPERRTRPGAAPPMSRWLARMLDEMDHGMLLVSLTGTLRHANQPAQRELARGDCLSEQRGHVMTGQGGQNHRFSQALADAARGRRCLLNLGPETEALSVAVVPMSNGDPEEEALVLLVLGKRQSCEALTVDFFARSQGLTAAETKVLQALCDGQRPKEAARQFNVAVSTIRTQISCIRAKTQTSSIRDLVNRVTTLPPITLAMKSMLPH